MSEQLDSQEQLTKKQKLEQLGICKAAIQKLLDKSTDTGHRNTYTDMLIQIGVITSDIENDKAHGTGIYGGGRSYQIL